MSTKILLDTNILVYMETSEEPEKKQIAIDTVEKNAKDTVLSMQNIAELSSVLSRRYLKNSTELNSRITQYLDSFETISYDCDTIKRANEISCEFDLHFFDSLLVATMEENQIYTILTENEKDFKKIPYLKIINPFRSSGL